MTDHNVAKKVAMPHWSLRLLLTKDHSFLSHIGVGSRGAPGAGAPPVFTVTP